MRKERARIFNGFESDPSQSKSFSIQDSIDNFEKLPTDHSLFSQAKYFLHDAKLTKVALQNDPESFVKYLQENKFLPELTPENQVKVAAVINSPDKKKNPNFAVYAATFVVILAIAAGVSVAFATASDDNITLLDSFGLSVELAGMMNGQAFSDKVKTYLIDNIKALQKGDQILARN